MKIPYQNRNPPGWPVSRFLSNRPKPVCAVISLGPMLP